MTRRPLVLIVDDEPSICWSLAEAFTEAGYDAVEATSARQTLAWLSRRATVDAVLLDLRIPDTHGFDLLEAIRTALPNCPIILMTADAPAEVKARARDAGVSHVVMKPFELGRMVALTRGVLLAHRPATA